VSLRPWLYLAACDLARDTRGVAGRFFLTVAAVAALAAFAASLPAYRDSFTAAVATAGFDVDVAGCACDDATLTRLRAAAGVDRLAGVLGLVDVPLAGPGRSAVAGFGWAIDSAADGDLTPIGPRRMVSGSFDLGSIAEPRVVLDRDLAGEVGAGPGDHVQMTLGGEELTFTVSGIAGSAARFRGPSFAMLRSVAAPLLPPGTELDRYPYTEVLLAGSITVDQVSELFRGDKAAVYSKADQIAALESQIEVSQPVIQVVSALAAFGLAVLLGFVATLAIERRRSLISLLPHLGASRGQAAIGILVVEGLPTSIAAVLGSIVGLVGIMGTYFARVSVYADPVAAIEAGLALAALYVGLLFGALAIRARRQP